MGNIIGELGTEIKRLERIINNNVSCLFTNLEDLLGELKFMVESIISFSEEDYCQELNELRIKSIDIMERIECLEEGENLEVELNDIEKNVKKAVISIIKEVITLHTDAKENGYDNYETRNGVYFPSTESSYDGFGDEDTPECPEYT